MTSTTARRVGNTGPVLLNQIVAIAGGVKTRTEQALTKAYHQIQKPAPFTGIARTYRPRDEDGEQLPAESTLVQVRATDLITEVSEAMTRMLDVVATQEWANTMASADVVVGDRVLLTAVPVTYLMWLEKQVISLRTFVSKLPVLDLAEQWHFDENAQAWAADPTEVTRTRKTPRNHVLAVATEHHPAQVEVYHEDLIVGYWRTIKFSGALPASRVFEISQRIEALLDAIRYAREQANTAEVNDVQAGEAIVNFVFSD